MMRKLLQPDSIAIIGASNTPDKVGNILANNLLEHGYEGEIYFINPSSDEILGHKAYKSLSDVGTSVDVAIVAIPAQFVASAIEASAAFCKNFVVISAGFGESGIAGHNAEMKLANLAEREGLTIVGPNCLGYITPSLKLNASFAPGMPAEGPVAFISQSGALAVALVDRASEFGIGFSSVVSIGNKMHVDAAVLIEHFAQDENTSVIALYLEGIKDGKSFLRATAHARKMGKHVILLKSGRSPQAQNAIALHTGSLAGDDAIVDVACEKSGITRVNSIAQLFSVVRIAIAVPLPKLLLHKHSRIAILTNAGGPGVVATDAIARAKNISIAELDEAFQSDLSRKLPPAASVHNPIDLLGDADIARYADGLAACLSSKDIDVVFVLLTPQKNTPVGQVAQSVIAAHKASEKPIIVSFIGGDSIAEARESMRHAGVMSFEAPDEAISSFDILSRTELHNQKDDVVTNPERAERVRALREKILDTGRTATYFEEASVFMQQYDIPVADFWDITGGLSATSRVEYPAVAKVDNPHVLHKSDRGGVILPITSGAHLEEARKELQEAFPENGTRIITQSLSDIEMELIIGIKKDVTFGHVVVIGIGGIYTEFLKKSQIFLPPFGIDEITEQLTVGPLGFLLTGVRGQDPYDVDAIAHIILSMMVLASEVPQIEAVDINPLLIYNDKREAKAVDVKIIFEKR